MTLLLLQTQFMLVCIHTSQLFFLPECDYPLTFGYWIGSYAVIFLVLFADFYIKSYRKPTATANKMLEKRPEMNGHNKHI